MKNRSTTLLTILPVLACFTLLPGARAVNPAPDGCFPNFTTAEGCDALSLLTTGAGNTALGWRSLFMDTTGSFNTGVGAGALILNNADSNTAVGAVALLLNTSGAQNTAIGTDALVFNDSGDSNTATGYFSLMNNTTGGSNTATGWEALIANTTGNNNTAIGNQALQSSETTSDHVAIGSMAGSGITTANNNIIIGHHSGVHSRFGEESDVLLYRQYPWWDVDDLPDRPRPCGRCRFRWKVGHDARCWPAELRVDFAGIQPQAIPDAAKQAMLDRQFRTCEQRSRATATN